MRPNGRDKESPVVEPASTAVDLRRVEKQAKDQANKTERVWWQWLTVLNEIGAVEAFIEGRVKRP